VNVRINKRKSFVPLNVYYMVLNAENFESFKVGDDFEYLLYLKCNRSTLRVVKVETHLKGFSLEYKTILAASVRNGEVTDHLNEFKVEYSKFWKCDLVTNKYSHGFKHHGLNIENFM